MRKTLFSQNINARYSIINLRFVYINKNDLVIFSKFLSAKSFDKKKTIFPQKYQNISFVNKNKYVNKN